MSSDKKKERRKQRHDKHVKEELTYKQEAWEAGKLIMENHNQNQFSPTFTSKLTDRLYSYILGERNSCKSAEDFVVGFRKYKAAIQELLIYWNPTCNKGSEYNYLKRLLEVYWDEVRDKQNPMALLDSAYDQ